MEALETVSAPEAHRSGALGHGVVWAMVGTGVDVSHPHFALHQNLVPPQGLSHYSIARERSDGGRGAVQIEAVDRPARPRMPYSTQITSLVAGASDEVTGVAPQAKIIVFDVLDDTGAGNELHIVRALELIAEINQASDGLRIHGACVALGSEPDLNNYACGSSPLCAATDRLVRSGVFVVVPTGNQLIGTGPQPVSPLSDPGNAELALTVGSTHRKDPQVHGPSTFSRRGPTFDGRPKPDLLAPGEKIRVCDPGGGTSRIDGTGPAAAIASGVAAALLSARSDLIGDPGRVKRLLTSTARDLGRGRPHQGSGVIDLARALSEADTPDDSDVEFRRPATETTGASPATPPARERVRLFCSYAHEDRDYWEEFQGHLSALERAGRLEVWWDGDLAGGDEWERRIEAEIDAADIVIFLVSSFFMQSEYINSKELTRALRRHEEQAARVIPIILRPVKWDRSPFAKLQALPPPDAQPVTTWGADDQGAAEADARHRAWYETIEALDDVIEQILDGRSPAASD